MMPSERLEPLHSGITHTEGFVEYTISSRGQPIGTSDLDFMRIDGSNRSGWFHPNALGESLMPTIALPYPAMRTFVCESERDENGRSVIRPDFRRSTVFADLAEAFHRVAALELTLHHPDGRLIPTSMLGIQDTDAMRRHLDWGDLYPVGEIPEDGEPWFEELKREFEDETDEWEESDDDLEVFEIDVPWVPDEMAEYPRYQVHLLLSEENAIP